MSHWSHFKVSETGSDFLCRNSSFLLWFLLLVERLDFFFFFLGNLVFYIFISR